MPLAKHYVFALLWLWVIGVSVHDGYLVLANRMTISVTEQNPIGHFLLYWNGNDVWLLLAVKTAGTICAATVLLLLYWTHRRVAWSVCLAAASVQLVLLLFLYFA